MPSSPAVVEALLSLAQVGPGDMFYDLGSGDGRLVIAAARRGARAIGVDLDASLITRSRDNARAAGVDAEFRQGNFFTADLTGATVVALYLLPRLNLALLPKLSKELSPGTRLLSHCFGMGDWKPSRQITVADGNVLMLWTFPG